MLFSMIVVIGQLGLGQSPDQDLTSELLYQKKIFRDYLTRSEQYEKKADRFEREILPSAAKLADDPEAKASLRKAFEARWLTGSGNPKLRLDRFARLAERCRPFGPGNAGLVD